MQLKPIAAALVAAGGLALALPAFSAGMTRDAYNAEKDKIDAAYKAEHARCADLKANAKDICQAEAKGKQKTAKADAEAQYKGTAKAQQDALVARADADYDVAKERCDDKSGEAKSACVNEAKATHSKAVADAKGKHQSAAVHMPARATTTTKEKP